MADFGPEWQLVNQCGYIQLSVECSGLHLIYDSERRSSTRVNSYLFGFLNDLRQCWSRPS